MHICFIAIDFHAEKSGGGIASYINTIGQEFIRQGHHVTVISKGLRHVEFDYESMRIIQIPLGNLHWYLYKTQVLSCFSLPVREIEWSLAINKCLQTILKSSDIDLIEGCETGGLFLNWLPQLPPVAIRLHGESYVFQKYSGHRIQLGAKINRKLEYRVLAKAAGVSSPSVCQAQVVASEMRWTLNQITVIPNPIHPQFISADTTDYSCHNENRQMVLYTGRIERSKGALTLLRSIPFVTRYFPDIEFILAGARHNSINDQQLSEVVNQDDIREHARLLGHISWSELIEWYRKASIFVMPSFYETFCISVIEAMVMGLPVVASNAGALPEIVEDNVTGLLFEPGDSLALADAIIRLLKDPELAKRMGAEGKKRVLRLYTPSQVAAQTLSFYTKILHEHLLAGTR